MGGNNNALNHTKPYRWAVVYLLLLRLVLNAIIPLMDQTEARYAEISRIMAQTGSWVTPQVDYGFPFWAKPPLSTWLSALSIKTFGVNEFAVRFPSFLIAVALILLLKPYAKRAGVNLAIPAFIILTIPEFLLHAGVVSTDMTLLLSLTLMMLSFWETVNGNRRFYKYLFFAAAGLGFLAKGPIVLILAGFPLVVWTVWFRQIKKAFLSFPWLFGIILFAAIALPWYWMAEKRTPGFLEYFFVGEHFKRFFDASWKGDKYGFPKTQPLGIIWVFLYTMALPWIIYVTLKVIKLKKEILKNPWLLFLLLWILWTPIFFTISTSLIHTYILPTVVPIALFVSWFWKNEEKKKIWFVTAMAVPVLAIMGIVLWFVPGVFENNTNTDKYILKDRKYSKLFYLNEKTYSSQFYSRGVVKTVNREELNNREAEQYLLLVKKGDSAGVKDAYHLKKIGESKKSLLFEHIPGKK